MKEIGFFCFIHSLLFPKKKNEVNGAWEKHLATHSEQSLLQSKEECLRCLFNTCTCTVVSLVWRNRAELIKVARHSNDIRAARHVQCKNALRYGERLCPSDWCLQKDVRNFPHEKKKETETKWLVASSLLRRWEFDIWGNIRAGYKQLHSVHVSERKEESEQKRDEKLSLAA